MAPTPPSNLPGYSRHLTRGSRLPNVDRTPTEMRAERGPITRRGRNLPPPTVVPDQEDEDDEDVDEDADEDAEEASEIGSDEDGDEDPADASAEEGDADEEGDDEGEVDDENADIENEGDAIHDEVPMEVDSLFDPTGLKEIGNLASWTVSTCKPGCGVEALRDDDTNLFWQSDGPQPHHLNIHFSRLVSIISIRIFLNFEADESYTPTRIALLAGTGYHDLIPFSSLEFTQPKGWIDVPLDGVGGGADGNTLRAFLVQVKIVENHQNGKDTHVRGLRIYARDEKTSRSLGRLDEWGLNGKNGNAAKTSADRIGFTTEPDWMGEPELR